MSILYIAGDNRSGSTLFELMLGAHSRVIALGELANLGAYVLEDRRLYDPVHPLVCFCGERVAECEFWRSVERTLGKRLGDLTTGPRARSTRRGGRSMSRAVVGGVRRVLERWPALVRWQAVRRLTGYSIYARNTVLVMRAARSVGKAKIVTDSSKCPIRMRAMYEEAGEDFRVVLLSRDFRGVIESKARRGMDRRAAAREWRRRAEAALSLSADLPASKVLRMRYESLCADPRSEMRRVASFLGIPFEEAMCAPGRTGIHHIGGSPSKFDPERAVVRVLSERVAWDARTTRVIQRIVGGTAAKLGY